VLKNYDFELKDLLDDKKLNRKIINLGSIKFDDLDFDSPIQRKGELWKKRYKKDLIGSILRGLPCGSIKEF
jgi:hypothetical protein